MKSPDPLLLESPLTDFVKTNIASQEEVNEAFSFDDMEEGCELVVYHAASAIRFWERWRYLRDLSQSVNVDGTRHILKATKSAQGFYTRSLIYISSAAVCVHQPRFFRLSRRIIPVHRDDIHVNPTLLNKNHYNRTKREAETLVRQANAVDLKTAILRP